MHDTRSNHRSTVRKSEIYVLKRKRDCWLKRKLANAPRKSLSNLSRRVAVPK
jgi:hypothetical protein